MFNLTSRQLRSFGAIAALSLATVCTIPSLAAATVPQANVPPAIAQSYIDDEIAYLIQSGQAWIEIDLGDQQLLAWEGDYLVYSAIVSTGKDETPTPTGVFSIYAKTPEGSMSGEDYSVPDVPYIMYYDGNYAIHGAYWHDAFGIPVSHGCTNVPVGQAGLLYDWASVGTPVVVHY
jgi:lipoprotein-anchoring transpeptidase ErfK/SrfK